jgi:hypothetical protein
VKNLQISLDRAYPRGEEEKDALGTTIHSPPKIELFLSHPAEGLRDDDPVLKPRVRLHNTFHHLFALSDNPFRLFENMGDDLPTIFFPGIEMNVRPSGRDDKSPPVDHRFDGRNKK